MLKNQQFSEQLHFYTKQKQEQQEQTENLRQKSDQNQMDHKIKKQAEIAQKMQELKIHKIQTNNLFGQQRTTGGGESQADLIVNNNNFIPTRNLNPQRSQPNTHENFPMNAELHYKNNKRSVRKQNPPMVNDQQNSMIAPPIILKIGTLTTNSENSMSADDNYFMPRTTNRQGSQVQNSPKVKVTDSEAGSDFLNSNRQQTNRRNTNLPGIKQRLTNDSTVITYQKQKNPSLMVDGGIPREQRFMPTNTGSNRNTLLQYEGSGNPVKHSFNQGQIQYQTVTSRNKGRGPKTIGNRTQADEVSNVIKKNLKISAYSGSPDRPLSTFVQPSKLREIQSTMHLLQAYQPGNIRPEVIKAFTQENSQGTMSNGGSIESENRNREFGGTFKQGMDLKSKRSEVGSKRGTRRVSKPPILPSGVMAAQNQTPKALLNNQDIPVLKKINNKNGNQSGPFSTYSTQPNFQNSSYFASPDDRQRQNFNQKFPQTKLGRNIQLNQQQPHTVREDVVQASGSISSVNISQQKVATSFKDNHARTPFKVKTILQDGNNHSSQPPSTMQVWSAVTMYSGGGGGSDIASQEDESQKTFPKRNFGRPSAIIKVRRKETPGAASNTNNKIATLRQPSNDSLEENHSRLRNGSVGSEVAIIEEANWLGDDVDGASLEDEDSLERRQRRRRESQGAFQKMLQIKQQIKTKRIAIGINDQMSGQALTTGMVSRNSPLGRGGVMFPGPPSGTNESENLSPQVHSVNGQRRAGQPLEITQNSLTESQQQQFNTTYHHKNKLPPSLKNYERDTILLSSGTLSNQLSIDAEGATTKKKVSIHKPSEVPSLMSSNQLQVVEERRGSKFVSMGGNLQQTIQFRNNSQPAPYQDQQSSSTSSKIDKILAKIEKNRSDSVLKNQLGLILKKNQIAQGNSETNVGQESHRRESLSQKLIVLRRENITGNYPEDASPEPKPQQSTKAVKIQEDSTASSNIAKQHKKILKLVTVANTNTLMNPQNAYSTIQQVSSQSSLQGGKIKKKNLKVGQKGIGSLEKAQNAFSTLQNNPHINDTRRQQQSSIKQIRDAKSQDIVTNMIEKQGIYLPADVSHHQETNEFSPTQNVGGASGQMLSLANKKGKKKMLVRIQSNEESKTNLKISSNSNNEVINNMMVITTSGDSQIVYQQQPIINKPIKKTIIQSLQPKQPKKVQHQLSLGTNSQQVMVFSSDGSDKQSTEISSHNVYPRPSNPAIPVSTPQDQSSLLCLTSGSNHFNKTACQQKSMNPMTIMDDVHSPFNDNTRNQQKFQLSNKNNSRTSIKENPLDCLSINQKGSARYFHPDKRGGMEIKEEMNEEKDEESNNGSRQQVKRRETLVKAGSRRITTGGENIATMNNSSINHEEVDLYIERIESDDKLFQDINLSSRKQKLIQENHQLFDHTHSYRRLNNRILNTKLTTVLEPVSELAVSSNFSGTLNRHNVSRAPSYNNQVEGSNNQLQQRYSQLEEQEEYKQVMCALENNHRMNIKGQMMGCDEDVQEIIVNEEDDEAIEIGNNPHFAKTTLTIPQTINTEPLLQNKKRQSQARKQKHWLLDSDRFDNMMNNNAQKQALQRCQDIDSESQMMQSDTVIFEKDQSTSMIHGTPPKIAQKINNQRQEGIKTGGDNHYEESNSQQSINHKNLYDRKEDSSVLITDSSRVQMMAGSDENKFAFTQRSFDLIRDQIQNAQVSKLFQKLEQLPDMKKAAQSFIKNLTKQMNIQRLDAKLPNNPHWIMNKQLKIQPPLEYYFRSTYYDVIYIQPQLDPAPSLTGGPLRNNVASSNNSQVSANTSKNQSSIVVGGSINKFQRPSVGFDQRYQKSKIKPVLEEFNFDSLTQ